MTLNIKGGLFNQSDVRETITNTEETSVAWNLAYVRYVQRFDTTLAGVLRGLFISDNGEHIYLVREDGAVSSVYQYDLSTAWDISPASLNQALDVSGREATVRGIHFNPEGTKMYTAGPSGDSIDEYNLSTAWDISTAVYSQEYSLNTAQGLFFRPDGKQMIVGRGGANSIQSYALTTAWDVSTAESTTDLAFNASEDIHVSRAGCYLFVVASGTTVHRYAMTTVYNIATAAADTTYEVAPTGNIKGITFNSNGTKMYLLVGTYIQEYTLKRGWRS